MTWLLSQPWVLKVGQWLFIALAVLLFLMGVRRQGEKAGRTAERLRNTERLNRATERVRNAQREVPRPDRSTVTDRLRNGDF